jgi:(S)-mandelate dehydrogenase
MRKPVNVADFRLLAKNRLPRMVFDYLEGGAEDENGLLHNRQVFEAIRFRPRRLVDVSERTVSTTLFGRTLSAPIIIAPTGLNDLLCQSRQLLRQQAESFGFNFM